jgi:succinate dehydrogenase / fumarate reductase, membrane anchor subunit
MSDAQLRSPLGRVLGLGSAKEGVGHWWAQRVTALALVPLTLWFVTSVVALAGADYDAFLDWFASPVVATMMVLLIIAVFYHLALGMQVVIEDYVHVEAQKIAAVLVLNLACFALATAAIVAVLKIAFGS